MEADYNYERRMLLARQVGRLTAIIKTALFSLDTARAYPEQAQQIAEETAIRLRGQLAAVEREDV